MSIELYKHNKETYEKMVEMFKTENRVGVVQPTGTGKSFLILKWIEEHPEDDFIILAPSTEIFTQLYEYAADTQGEIILSKVKMISYQTLNVMELEEINNLTADKIILDEFHRAGAEQWGPAVEKLLSVNMQSKIFGLSATPIRYLDNGRNMADELFEGKLAREMTLGEAVAKGILPKPTYIKFLYNIKEKINKYKEEMQTVENETERAKLEKELEKAKRHLEKADGTEKIFKTHMPDNQGKYIVFCIDRTHLHEMIPVVEQWLEQVNKNVHSYISISESSDKELQLKAFREDNDNTTIKLLFTIDRLNEGIHVKGIDGVIMLRPTISPIIYLQQMGRALASVNKTPIIFDMVNNYDNIQVPFNKENDEKKAINVFEKEYIENSDTEKFERFKIYDEVAQFNQIFRDIDYILYPTNDELWFKWFELYKEFINVKGREPKDKEEYNEFNIGRWVCRQREDYKKGKLSPDKIKILLDAGFDFDPKETQWYEKFKASKEFIDIEGRMPQVGDVYNGVRVGTWWREQKKNYTQGLLRPEREKLLRETGFEFESRHEIIMIEYINNVQLYKDFKNEKGREPQKKEIYKGFKISVWCGKQRYDYNRGKLSEEKLRLLQEAEFDFEPEVTQFKYKLEMCKKFIKERGRLPRKNDVYNEVKVGAWYSHIRKLYSKGLLDEKKVQLLQNAGFDFYSLTNGIGKETEIYEER